MIYHFRELVFNLLTYESNYYLVLLKPQKCNYCEMTTKVRKGLRWRKRMSWIIAIFVGIHSISYEKRKHKTINAIVFAVEGLTSIYEPSEEWQTIEDNIVQRLNNECNVTLK